MFDMIPRKRKPRESRTGGRLKLRRFLRREDGTVAVEFALVAAPFLALLFAIMETALVFFAGQTLETAAADVGRLILTGQAQTAGLTQASFKDQVCARIFGLFDCENGMYVDVKTYSDFASVDLTEPIDKDGKLDTSNFTYSPGGPCDIVVARLMYQFPTFVSLLGFDLSDMSGGKRLLVATSVFRNEPYAGSCS
jgi:Flp pilus assembly protein TadG